MTEELAWAAGFFDGEGSITVQKKSNRQGEHTGRLALRVSAMQCDPRPLLRLAAAVGHGNVRGPYTRKRVRNEAAIYGWEVSCLPALGVMGRLWPFLSEPKREQFLRVAEKISEASR